MAWRNRASEDALPTMCSSTRSRGPGRERARRGEVPAPHRVRGMFGILEECLAEIDRETEHALGEHTSSVGIYVHFHGMHPRNQDGGGFEVPNCYGGVIVI